MRNPSGTLIRGLPLLCGLLAASGCAGLSYPFVQNAIDPSAEGSVRVGKGDNGNTSVSVQVRHLAPPTRIDPTARTFVVWASAVEGDVRPFKLGALLVNSDECGQLDTVTVLNRFKVFVTAEPSANVDAPTGQAVLQTLVDKS